MLILKINQPQGIRPMKKLKLYCDQTSDLLSQILKASNSMASFEQLIKKDTAMKISYALIKDEAVILTDMEVINLRNTITQSAYAKKNPDCMVLAELIQEINE